MPISIEEVYIEALKTQIRKWKRAVIQRKRAPKGDIEKKETPEHVMMTIKTFLFNEALYAEITKTALLMCENPESELQKKIQ